MSGSIFWSRELLSIPSARSFVALGAGIASTLGLFWAVNDYRAWASVKGGFPTNPFIWCWTYYIKWTLCSVTAKAEHLEHLLHHRDTRQYLHLLPARALPRPIMIKWPAPQRQLTERGTPAMLNLVQQSMIELADKNALVLGPSLREAHQGLAIYAQIRGPGVVPSITADRLHSHPLCGSLHVHLHPRDALEVVRAGWGEPFALACCGRRSNCHDGLVLVYAPRSEKELKVVHRIIEAGVMYLFTRLE